MQLTEMLETLDISTLEILDFRDIDFGQEESATLKRLVGIIQSASNLKKISFFNTNLGQVSIENLNLILDAIRTKEPSLAINLAANDLGLVPKVFSKILIQLLNSKITTLDLDSNQLSLLPQATIEELCAFIKDNDSLQELRLSSNNLGESRDNNLLLFGQLVLKCKNLKTLDLRDNSLGDNPTIKDFLTLLHAINLMHLDLSSNNFFNLYTSAEKNKDLGPFFACLILIAQHPSLQNLCLADNLLCGWGTDYLELFFNKILENEKLKSLNLNGNQFGILIKQESKKDFTDKFSTFVRKANQFDLTINYESGNFDTLEEIDYIVTSSEVRSHFWQERHSHLTLEGIAQVAYQLLRSHPLIQKTLINTATRQPLLTKLYALITPPVKHTVEETRNEESLQL